MTVEPAQSELPLVVVVADDAAVAGRIEAVLGDGTLLVVRSAASGDEQTPAGPAPDVLVAVFGRGVTERDQRMRRLRRALPETHLVAIVPEDSRRGVRRALEAGADGVVFVQEIDIALPSTVKAVLAGQAVVPAVSRHAVDRPTLSIREKQILGLVVQGMSNKEIAAKLYLAESTVKCHLSSSFAKLGVRSRNEATDLLLHSGVGRDVELAAQPAYACAPGTSS